MLLLERLDALEGGLGPGQGGHNAHAMGVGGGTDLVFVLTRDLAGGRVDDELDLAVLDHIDRIGPAFVDLGQASDRHAVIGQDLGGAASRKDVEAEGDQLARGVDDEGLVGVFDREEDVTSDRQAGLGGGLSLGEGNAEIGIETHDLAGGAHLGREHDGGAREAGKGTPPPSRTSVSGSARE